MYRRVGRTTAGAELSPSSKPGSLPTEPYDAAQAGEFLTALGPNPQLQDPFRSLNTQSACWTRRLTSAATDQSYPCFSGRLIPAAMDWMVRYDQEEFLHGRNTALQESYGHRNAQANLKQKYSSYRSILFLFYFMTPWMRCSI